MYITVFHNFSTFSVCSCWCVIIVYSLLMDISYISHSGFVSFGNVSRCQSGYRYDGHMHKYEVEG
jgi:hypothetical protein